MKKITTLFLIIFAICLLTACRTEPATEPQTQAPTETAPSVSPENTALTPTPTPTPTQPTETIPPEPVDTSIEEWRKLAYEYINWERRYTKQGADLDKLKIGMSYEEVVEIFGRGRFQGLYSGMPRPLFVLGKPDAFAWVLSDDVRYTFKETMVSMTIYFENSAIHDNGKERVDHMAYDVKWMYSDRMRCYIFPKSYGNVPKVVIAELYDSDNQKKYILTENGWEHTDPSNN